jgi:GAF domain-containing protein
MEPMTSAPQYEPDRVGGRGTLVLDESVLELYFAADHPAAVETAVLELAMRVIPCGYAGLTAATIDGGLVVGSDPVVHQADRLQTALGEGPRWMPGAVDAVVCVVDTATDVRWPQWGQEVAALGLRSMLSVELSARSAGLGALVIYSPVPDWFGGAEQQTAATVALHAAVAIAARREQSRLRQAMDSLSSPLGDADGRIRG